MRPKKNFCEKAKLQVVEYAQDPTLTLAEISAKFGCSRSSIGVWCRKFGKPRNARKRITEEKWQGIDKYLGTMSDADIGRKFGVVPSTVYERRRALGIDSYQPHTREYRRKLLHHEIHQQLCSWGIPDGLKELLEEIKCAS